MQKVDALVLAQILAVQNIELTLPDTPHSAELSAETLIAISGVAACRVCLQGVTIQKGEVDHGVAFFFTLPRSNQQRD